VLSLLQYLLSSKIRLNCKN